MKERPILSIFIATYNRKEILLSKIKTLLNVKSNDFNIFVLDDMSTDGTFDALNDVSDTRLHIYQNEERKGTLKDGVMQNWYRLLEMCDGQFAFHLNDRDLIDANGVTDLIEFLKKHRMMTGGICNIRGGYKLLESLEECYMSVPYFGSHPTGIIFNIDEYRLLKNRQKMFTREAAYIHPHDLVLGQLAECGKMFQYKKIWSLAGTESFANNKSFLYKKGNSDDAWFSPKARTQEFRLFVAQIANSSFDIKLKRKKATQIAKRYLFYCTLNYEFFISDLGQAAHYGIEPQKLSQRELLSVMRSFVDESYEILMAEGLNVNEKKYKVIMKVYFWTIYFGKPVWDKVKRIKKVG